MDWLRAIIAWLASLLSPAEPEPVPIPTPEPEIGPVEPPKPSTRENLYVAAKASLGVDWTPEDVIPDSVACVSHLQEIYRKATGSYIGKGAARYNTKGLLLVIAADSRFKRVASDEALPGDIAICATGEGRDPSDHGHCWIVGKTHWMSNTSATGNWEANYTKEEVLNFFVKRRGFTLHVFRPL